MLYAQIDKENSISIIETDSAYPGGGWEIVKPLMEDMGFLFIELDGNALPGAHYDREKGEFYTPEPLPPEPTQEELNNLALMEGIAGLYETQVALEDRMTTDNITVMEGLAGLFEAQMGGI